MTKPDSKPIRVSQDVLREIDSRRKHPLERPDSVLRRVFRLPQKKHWRQK